MLGRMLGFQQSPHQELTAALRRTMQLAHDLVGRPRCSALVVCATVFAVNLSITGGVEAAGEAKIRMMLGNRPVEGMALSWSAERALLLRRDGQILAFSPADATDIQRAPDVFRALSSTDLRGPLLREFGPNFDVQLAGSYIVVHPKDRSVPWAKQFDALHRSFLHYFASRGLATAKPRFPLVAVVLPDRRAFLKYAARENAQLPAHCAGYYSNFSNRVVQYDHGEGNNAELIIHEASHQVAFNTGLHHRGSPPPRWVSEGLGTMFEAPGVWNSVAHPSLKDRINRRQLEAFRKFLPDRPQGTLASFVSNDWLFRTNTPAAYAEAWALSFFLSETRPRAWANYLRITSSTKRNANPTSPELLQEFISAFGPDLKSLESRYLRYISQLQGMP